VGEEGEAGDSRLKFPRDRRLGGLVLAAVEDVFRYLSAQPDFRNLPHRHMSSKIYQ